MNAKDCVEVLFSACDLDGNGYIEILEFMTLLECIEPKKLEFE